MKSTEAETIAVGAMSIRFLVEPEDANASISVFECDVPADARMPAPHSHDAFEETIYGLRGVTTFTVGGETIEIGPGDAVSIPSGIIHGFANHGSTDATFLAMVSPGVFGPSYFHEIGEVLAATAGGPPDLAAIAEVMRRHGLTPAPPSP
jgi:quercetin dioxygenase-like cupin family protein